MSRPMRAGGWCGASRATMTAAPQVRKPTCGSLTTKWRRTQQRPPNGSGPAAFAMSFLRLPLPPAPYTRRAEQAGAD